MRKPPVLKTALALICSAAFHLCGAEPVTNSVSQAVYPAGQDWVTNSPAPTNNPGFNLHKGMDEAGFALGGSLGSRIFGSQEAHDFALARLSIGRVWSNVIGGDNWYRGDCELMGEVMGGWQVHPQGGYFAGVTPVLRYNFTAGKRWTPFYDIGFGVTAVDIGHPDLHGVFQFNLQTGPGIRWLVSQNTALTLQYRFLHLSNASISSPNLGVNTSAFCVGMSWFF